MVAKETEAGRQMEALMAPKSRPRTVSSRSHDDLRGDAPRRC